MTREFTLTDVANDIWLDSFKLGNQTLPLATPHVWSIRKRTLHGGLRDGVDMIEVHNGFLSFSVLPTGGMGLWRGAYRGMALGWQAPRLGPVNPKFVDPQDCGGIGWLTGFDEWLCRCGLSSAGPPGDDAGMALTLHGRIANQPAHKVSVAVETAPPFAISIRGEVEEGGLFYQRLRLTTIYTTIPGSDRIDVRDEVVNLGGTSAEMQLLYHCNLGSPLLAAGSRVRVPVCELWPLTDRAALALDHRDIYEPPTPGFAEEVFCVFPQADTAGRTLAMLHDPSAERALVVRWGVQSLPCFTFWKNTAAIEDGYVTGIEPATCFPRFKAKEREAGRVITLSPGSRWLAEWSMEVTDDPKEVAESIAEIDAIESQQTPIIHQEPLV